MHTNDGNIDSSHGLARDTQKKPSGLKHRFGAGPFRNKRPIKPAREACPSPRSLTLSRIPLRPIRKAAAPARIKKRKRH